MNIELKLVPPPTEVGTYICQRPGRGPLSDTSPQVAWIRRYKDEKGLTFLHGLSIFPLEELEDGCLWSERINFIL